MVLLMAAFLYAVGGTRRNNADNLNQTPGFVVFVDGVGKRGGKSPQGGLEADAVLFDVARGLVRVPLKPGYHVGLLLQKYMYSQNEGGVRAGQIREFRIISGHSLKCTAAGPTPLYLWRLQTGRSQCLYLMKNPSTPVWAH